MGCTSSKVAQSSSTVVPFPPQQKATFAAFATSAPPASHPASLPSLASTTASNAGVAGSELTDLSALKPLEHEGDEEQRPKVSGSALPRTISRANSYAREDYQFRRERSRQEGEETTAPSLRINAVSPERRPQPFLTLQSLPVTASGGAAARAALALSGASPVPRANAAPLSPLKSALALAPLSHEPRVMDALASRRTMAEAIRGRSNSGVALQSPQKMQQQQQARPSVYQQHHQHHHHHQRRQSVYEMLDPVTLQEAMMMASCAPDSARDATESSSLSALSSSPKTDEEKVFLRDALKRCFVTAGLQKAELERVVEAMQAQHVSPGEVIAQGDKLRAAFIVGPEDGSALKLETTRDKKGIKITAAERFEPGMMCGEVALVHGHTGGDVTVTLTAMGKASFTVYRLDKSAFKKIVLVAAVAAFEHHKLFLKKCALFASFDEEQIARLVDAAQHVTFAGNERIIQEGDKGNAFFLVLSGAVRVVKEQHDEDENLAIVAGILPSEMTTASAATERPWRGDSCGVSPNVVTVMDGAPLVFQSPTSTMSAPSSSRSDGSGGSSDDTPVGEHGMRSREVELLQLGPGSHFGEQSLLHATRRTWSVIAVGEVELLAIGKDEFLSLFGSLRKLLDHHHQAREDIAAAIEGMNRQRKAAATAEGANSPVVSNLTRGTALTAASRYLTADGNFLEQLSEADDLDRESPYVPMNIAMSPAAAGGHGRLAMAKMNSLSVSGLRSPSSFYFFERNGSLTAVPDVSALERQLTRKASGGRLTSALGACSPSVSLTSRTQTAPSVSISILPLSPESKSGHRALKPSPLASASGGLPPLTPGHSRNASGFNPAPTLSSSPSSVNNPIEAETTEKEKVFKSDVADSRSKEEEKRSAAEAEARSKIEFSDLETIGALGKGAFGTVSLVRHKSTGQRFALKEMSKALIVEKKQEKNVANEQQVLRKLRGHPFAVQYIRSFTTESHLYFLQELACGDLFSFVETNYKDGRVGFAEARYYCACIAATLHYLHSKKRFVYRDLKPENLLIGEDGSVKCADFGFARALGEDGRCKTFCGTPEYLAPCIILQRGYYGPGVDWWALGVLLYELLHGYSPFYRAAVDAAGGAAGAAPAGPDAEEGIDTVQLYRAILKGKFTFSSSFMAGGSSEAVKVTKDFISRLLQTSAARRLGCGERQGKEVLRHPFFAGLSWEALLAGKITAPVKPAASASLQPNASAFPGF